MVTTAGLTFSTRSAKLKGVPCSNMCGGADLVDADGTARVLDSGLVTDAVLPLSAPCGANTTAPAPNARTATSAAPSNKRVHCRESGLWPEESGCIVIVFVLVAGVVLDPSLETTFAPYPYGDLSETLRVFYGPARFFRDLRAVTLNASSRGWVPSDRQGKPLDSDFSRPDQRADGTCGGATGR